MHRVFILSILGVTYNLCFGVYVVTLIFDMNEEKLPKEFDKSLRSSEIYTHFILNRSFGSMCLKIPENIVNHIVDEERKFVDYSFSIHK